MDSGDQAGSPAVPQLRQYIYVDSDQRLFALRDTHWFVFVIRQWCVYCEVLTKLSCYVDELRSQNVYKPKVQCLTSHAWHCTLEDGCQCIRRIPPYSVLKKVAAGSS